MKKILTLSSFLFLYSAFGQNEGSEQTLFADKIIVSQGKCTEECGYAKGFKNLVFYNEIEFNLNDSSTYFRKKLNQKKKEIAYQHQLLDSTYIRSIDSIITNFENIKFSYGKYHFYRIELIYVLDIDLQLPVKKKVVEFWISTNPTILHPKEIDELLNEYERATTIAKNS